MNIPAARLSPRTVHAATRWYKEPFAWLAFGIPALAVALGVLTLGLSLYEFDGLVVDDYYKRGKEINRTMERDQAAIRHGLSAILTIGPDRLAVQLHNRVAGFHQPQRLQLTLLHATRAGRDHTLLLEHAGDGRYVAQWSAPGIGRWYLQIEADDWRLRSSAQLPETMQLEFLATAAD